MAHSTNRLRDGVTRRGFIRATTWLGAGYLASGQTRGAEGGARQATDDRIEGFTAEILKTYDSQGVHRTGTDVDRQSGEWLRGEAERASGRASLEGFALNRFDPVNAFVEVGGQRFEGLPFFDGGTTDAAGVSGPIGPGSVHFAVVDRAALGTEGEFLAATRRDGQTHAIVVATSTDVPGLVPSNARHFANPYGCPVLQVSSTAREPLEQARRDGTSVRVVCHATRSAVTAFNVVAMVEGRDRTLAPVVVITPRSGWWNCAAERGGGIVCWLEALRAAGAAQTRRRVMFLASSGHELGHLGLDAFLHANTSLIKSAHAWIHLGANIGAGDPETAAGARLQASGDDLEHAMATALDAFKAPIADRLPRGRVPAGEARNLHTGGARYVSVLGQGNRWFHHADDRYPRSVGAPLVARYARGVARAVVTLAG